MAKYPINKNFFPYTHLYPQINKLTLPFINFCLRLMPKHLRSDSDISIRQIKIPTSKKQQISAYLFEPKMSANIDSPCLIYFHGGGFVLHAAPYHYALAKNYAIKTPCKVLFVCYRLAPKYPFPVPVEDCYSALNWLVENSCKLKVDKNRIAVGGDSAGGNLAACVSIMARDRNLTDLCGQMLVYPVIDRRMTTESMKKFTDTPMWNSKLSQKMWKYYLKNSTANLAYACPIEFCTLGNLPPAYIETAEFDCLIDEAIDYAAALKQANVNVTLQQTNGTMHGFDIVLKSPITIESIESRISFLQDCFKL